MIFDIPNGTTHKNPKHNRYGMTVFDWFNINPETGEVLEWYTPYRETKPRWAPPLASLVTKEYWHEHLIPVDQEYTLEPKPWHKATSIGSKHYDRLENIYYPSSKGYQGD